MLPRIHEPFFFVQESSERTSSMLIKLGVSRNLAHMRIAWKLYAALQGRESVDTVWSLIADMKGPLIKVLQVLAGMPGLWSSPVAARLQLLSTARIPLSQEAWRTYVQEMLPELYPHISLEDAFPGSLGQVHRIRKGDFRACKIQYPRMQEVLAQDFHLLELGNRAYQWWGAAIEVAPLLNHLKHVLQQELDYVQEGRWMQWFSKHFEHIPWIEVPVYGEECSTERLLMMSWLEGNRFDETLSVLGQEERNTLSWRLMYAWYHPFFTQGILHADPHVENYKWSDTLSIQMLDFGCVWSFRPSWVEGTKKLYAALLHDEDTREIYYDYFGFDPLSPVQKECIDQWVGFMYSPFLHDGPRVLPESMTREGLSLLKRVHSVLRSEGTLRLPCEFLLLDRACIALGSALIRLQGKLCWKTCFKRLMNGEFCV